MQWLLAVAEAVSRPLLSRSRDAAWTPEPAVLTCLAQAPSPWHPLEHPTAEQVLDLHQTHALHHWPRVALVRAQLIQVPTWAYELPWEKPSFQPPG